MPDSAHIRGYIDAGVNPGIVLISLRMTAPSGDKKKSTRARPSQPSALKALTDISRTRLLGFGRQARRHLKGDALLAEILRLEVVELVARRSP